ncbi:MAG: addiction module toxin, HicA family [Desulfamplus sp.]|nr:addiction module toxin, HicA family [Desulfamplus sp.]MBF0259977.1 addiction module toxin, HicA family [Desulfamplus sp.]
MKRNELLRHLSKNYCELLREGSRHSIWRNIRLGNMTAIPRHSEIKEFMVLKICRDLDIDKP